MSVLKTRMLKSLFSLTIFVMVAAMVAGCATLPLLAKLPPPGQKPPPPPKRLAATMVFFALRWTHASRPQIFGTRISPAPSSCKG